MKWKFGKKKKQEKKDTEKNNNTEVVEETKKKEKPDEGIEMVKKKAQELESAIEDGKNAKETLEIMQKKVILEMTRCIGYLKHKGNRLNHKKGGFIVLGKALYKDEKYLLSLAKKFDGRAKLGGDASLEGLLPDKASTVGKLLNFDLNSINFYAFKTEEIGKLELKLMNLDELLELYQNCLKSLEAYNKSKHEERKQVIDSFIKPFTKAVLNTTKDKVDLEKLLKGRKELDGLCNDFEKRWPTPKAPEPKTAEK